MILKVYIKKLLKIHTVGGPAIEQVHIDINPLKRIFDIRLRRSICAERSICLLRKRGIYIISNLSVAKIYRICRKANISSRAVCGNARHIDKFNIRICGHKCSACQEKRTENIKHSLSFSCQFEYTALSQTPLTNLFFLI